MAEDKEAFLSRWSRLKREEAAKPPEPAPVAATPAADAEDGEAPPLPPVEGLTPESDFTPFMQGKVPPETRRAALKKLFSDPQFNVPDPYEAYAGDWTVGEPIPLEMLKTLNQAKRILFDEPLPGEVQPGEPQQQVIAAAEPAPAEAPLDGQVKLESAAKEEHGGAGRQDTQGL